MTHIFEKIYRANHTFYRGYPEKYTFDNDHATFLSDTDKYAIVYAKMLKNSTDIDINQESFIYEIKLKSDLNIFDANDESDLKKLLSKIDLNDNQISILKNKDWLYLHDGVNRGQIEDILKQLNYDGYKNNEFVSGMILDSEYAYEAKGSGYCIFDASKLDIVDIYDADDYMAEKNIFFEDCVYFI